MRGKGMNKESKHGAAMKRPLTEKINLSPLFPLFLKKTKSVPLFLILCAILIIPNIANATAGDFYEKGLTYQVATYTNHPNWWGATNDLWVVDINAIGGDLNRAVYAPESGTVQQVTTATSGNGWGNSIIWKSIDGSEEIHVAHLNQVVKTGNINGGDLIAYAGNTGNIVDKSGTDQGAHLHVSMRVNGQQAPVVLSGVQLVPSYVYNGNSYVSKGPITSTPTCYDPMVSLTIGATAISDSICQGYYQQYSFPITSGKQYKVTVTPSSGDPDLYLHSTSSVSNTTYTYASTNSGTSVDSYTFTASSSGTYYAAVYGYASGTSNYTIKVEDVTPASLLSAPTLSTPSNGATGVSTTPTFSWSAVTGANRYWLMVTTNSADFPTDPNATSCSGCANTGLSGNTDATSFTAGNTFPYSGTSRTLNSGTTYYWKVQAWNTNGTQGNYPNASSFSTASSQTLSVSLSASPSSGTAPLSTNLSADISGTASGTVNYTFWYNCNNSGTSVDSVMTACGSIPTPTTGSCSSNSNGIKCNGVTDDPKVVSNTYSSAGTYTAKVIAERGSASPAESRVTITVSGDTTAPTGSININSSASYTTSTSVTLSLSASDSVGVAGYYISTSSSTPSSSASGWTTVTSTTSYSSSVSYTLSSGDGSKTIYVWYKDSAGNVSSTYNDSITLDSTAPTNGSLSSTGGSGQVSLSWSGFSDSTSGIASYKLVYSTSSSPSSCSSGTQIYSGSSTSYTHSSLSNGTTYYYRVCATDNAGNTSSGTTASATTQTSSLSIPTLISPGEAIGSTHTPIAYSSVTFSWNKNNTGATYNLYVRDITGYADDVSTSYGTLVINGQNVGDISSYTWTSTQAGKKYRWQVEVVKSGYASVLSEKLVFETQSGDSAAPTGSVSINSGSSYTTATSVTLSLSASDSVGVTGYYVSTSSSTPLSSASGWTSVTSTISYSANPSYTLSSGDGTKTVYVWYKDSAGNVSSTYNDSITLDSTAPTNGSLSATGGSGQVSLSWSGFSDATSGVASYKLVYSTSGTPSSCSSGTQIYSSTGTSYTHSSLSSGTTYYYRVCAVDNAGNTSTGATASATTPTTPYTVTPSAGSNGTISPSTAQTISSGSTASFTITSNSGYSISSVTGCNGTLSVNTYTTGAITSNCTVTATFVLAPSGAAPTVSTNSATSVTFYSATLNGTVNPNGQSTTAWFEYGTTASYGNTTGTWFPIDTTRSLSYSLVGLSSSTTYHFRIVAQNSGGTTTYGSDQSFITSDTTPPTGTISINSGAASTNSTSTTLTLTCTDGGGCSQMQFSNDNATWSTAETYATNKTWTLSSGDGTKTVYVKFKDTAGNWSSAYSDMIVLDATAPTTTASPAGGTYNSTQSVTLTCSDGMGSGCDKIYYTTDGTTPTTASTLYSTAISISASQTLKFFAKDMAGNSETVKTATYTIDTTAPTGTISINSGAASTNSTTSTLTLSCTDGGSGCAQMQFSNDNLTWSTAEAYTTSKTWTLSSGDGTKTVYVKFKDTAGNWSTATISDTIVLDTAVPDTSITANPTDPSNSSSASFSFASTETGATFQCQLDGGGYSSCTSPNAYTGLTAGSHTFYVKATDAAGNTDSTPASYTWTIDTTAPTVTINAVTTPTNSTSQTITGTVEAGATVNVATDTAASDGAATVTGTTWNYTITGLVVGTNNVTVTATDAAGNTATKISAVVLDATAPVLTLSTFSNGAVTNNNTLNISGTVTDNTGIQGLTVNGNAVTVNADGSFSYALVLNEGANVITTIATDLAGNQTTDTRTITLDTRIALNISNPADNSKTALSVTTVTGTVDENATVTITTNGGSPQYASVIGNTFTLDILLAFGVNTIEITATDTAGNTSTQKRTATYDNTKPSLEITGPNQDMRTNQGSVLIKGTVSDALTAVSVSVAVDGNTYTPTLTNGQFEQALTFTTEKTYTIIVAAIDEVGNEATVQRNIIYDITQPTVDFTVTTPTNSSSQTISGTMEEGSTITVTSATATIGIVSYPTSTTWSVNISGMAEGNNIITATAKDAAGNEITVEKQIIVDTIVPVTTATPVGGAYTSTQTVTLTANETATIRYTVDGTIPTASSPVYNAPITLAGSTALSFFATDAAGNAEGVKTLSYTINPVAAIDITPPSNVSNLTATSKDDGSISLTWTASTDADLKGYNIYRDGVRLNAAPVTTNRYTDTNTVTGSSYTYKITSIDLAGNESSGVTGTATSTAQTNTPPAAPVNIKVEDTGTGYSFNVVWSSNTESDLAGYKVYWGTASGTYTNSQNVGNITAYEITGLTQGTRYYVVVSAYDTDGNESAKSIEATGTPKAYASRPDPATGLTLTPGNGYLTLSWTGVSNVTGYMVYIGETDGVYGTPVRTTSTTYTFQNLTNGKTYYVAVSSYDLSTGSRYTISSESERTTSSGVPYDNEPPAVPSNFSATDTGAGGSVSLKWDREESFDIAGYMIAYKVSGTSAFTGMQSIGIGWSHTITGLANGTSYTFNVYAYDATGNFSAPASYQAIPTGSGSTVDLTPPDVPILSAVPGNGKVSLIISSTGNDADHYNLYIYNLASGKYMPLTSIRGLSYEHSTGVDNGKALTFVATAVDAAGNESGYSEPVSAVPNELPGDIPLEEDPPVLDRVDGYDVNEIAKGFGANVGEPNYNPNADLDGNGVVDGNDLLILAPNHGKKKE